MKRILFLIAVLLGSIVMFAQETVTNNKLLPIRKFYVGDVEFVMVSVKGGLYMMGEKPSHLDKLQAKQYSCPIPNIIHEVYLSDFSIGQTEVTQELWNAVMDNNPSPFKGDNLPVFGISWDECKRFIAKLNSLTGESFRMPTEAEWEYAARGGKQSKHYKYAGGNHLKTVAWEGGTPRPVSTKKPNELGLYDMSGNVPEWCEDTFDATFYYNGLYDSNNPHKSNPKIAEDPINNELDDNKVVRGGGEISDDAYDFRVTSRGRCKKNNHQDRPIGFRLALGQ